jgi:hypothetical protein
MRRFVVLFSVATLSLVGGVIGTSAVVSGSTDTTVPSDAATEVHPVVGTWDLVETADPEHPFVLAFSADGNVVSLEEGEVSLGVWETTGPTSAALTITQQIPPEEISGVEGASLIIRATIEVAPDGQSLTADYTVEPGGMEWIPAGTEYGPGHLTGTRVVVEPMGTPDGSLEELFSDEESTEGTEVAAPPATEMAPPATEMAPPTTS